MSDPELTKLLDLSFATSIEALVRQLIQPKIDSLAQHQGTLGVARRELRLRYSDSFRTYLGGLTHTVGSLNTIALDDAVSLQQVYHPARVYSPSLDVTYTLDHFDPRVLSSHGQALLVDTAGMGKTTVMKWLCLNCIRKEHGIPLFVDLRRLTADETLLDYILKAITPVDQKPDTKLLLKLLKKGDFILFLDGFDEIRLSEQESVGRQITDLVSKARDNIYVMSSRPDEHLSFFTTFKPLTLDALKLDDAKALIRNYDKMAEKPIAEKLIRDIEERSNEVEPFLQTPLGVSLLYRAYTLKGDVPKGKWTFYHDLYRVLYKDNDRRKGFDREKRSGLSLEEFQAVVARFAFDGVKKGVVAYREAELLSDLGDAVKYTSGIRTSVASFMDDLITAVPIMSREGDWIQWNHQNLQSYFAAEFIYGSAVKREIMQNMVTSGKERYIPVIDFIKSKDPHIFRVVVTYGVAKAYLAYCQRLREQGVPMAEGFVQRRAAAMFEASVHLRILSSGSCESHAGGRGGRWVRRASDRILVSLKPAFPRRLLEEFGLAELRGGSPILPLPLELPALDRLPPQDLEVAWGGCDSTYEAVTEAILAASAPKGGRPISFHRCMEFVSEVEAIGNRGGQGDVLAGI